MKVRNRRRPGATRLCLLAWLPLLVAAGVTRAEAQTKAYVAHPGANVVSVIDTATGHGRRARFPSAPDPHESPLPATAAARMSRTETPTPSR